MASVRSEYQRFLAHLATVQVSDDVRRMANLIMAHLSTLEDVGAARRARSVRLAPLAVAQLIQTAAESPPMVMDGASDRQLGRLHELQVGPFRGFMRQESFDLSRDITLVYGANGTGKSSFCEALEVSMLGSISEAQVKRVDQRVYCNNARLGRHVMPRLTSRLAGQPATQVSPSEDDYRFCFIEKNRIEDFARIAARTPGDQRQLIATLFGVDQFSEFVRGFNPSIDENLQLVGTRAQQLDIRRNQLAASRQAVELYAEKVARLDQEERELAQRVHPGSTFDGCYQWMLGTPEQQGRLPYLQAMLETVPPVIHGITQVRLQELLTEAYRLHNLWQATTVQLAARAGQVSYSQLYGALLALSDGATTCPACGTDLSDVAHNPFEHAKAGLSQLAELAELQRRELQQRNWLSDTLRSLLAAMRAAVTAAGIVCPDTLHAANLPQLPEISTGEWLSAWIDQDRRAWVALLNTIALIERSDAHARAMHDQHGALVEERTRIDYFRLEFERCRTRRAIVQEDLTRAQAIVSQFDELNRELAAQVEAEAAIVQHHCVVKAAYDGFLAELQGYLGCLPAKLLQGLGLQARDLYNAFNRDDPASDLLHALWLPLTENGKVELEFAAEPGVRYDALVILSEGHIKCLGLAILLAKNLAQLCPVVVFDDVVNAIDDEHRNGIWRTFFEDGILDGKQIILTSHAEEFLHRIQQELGAQRAGSLKQYKFLHHLGEHELRVDSDPPTKNYVLLSQGSLARDEKRDALRYARPAIESLTDRLWIWMSRHADGNVELRLRSPRANWELNNKCTKLRGALTRRVSAHPAGASIIVALDRLLGVDGGSIEWGYLNSGTHDAQLDHEFDRSTVRTIVEATVALDAALSKLQNPTERARREISQVDEVTVPISASKG